ncbi:MAG: hypothetical protein WC374_13545 [Phycisphaerae bacterium]|jgi:hypothetical protein
MYYFSRKEEDVCLECDVCGKVYTFNRKYFSVVADSHCINNTPLQCPNCKNYTETSTRIVSKNNRTLDASIKCPRCGSEQITANKKGYGVGKAAAGVILTGGIGLLAGGIGSKKVIITCLNCGHGWKAGKKR